MVDIDFFKAVNDKCGHLTGDKVLTVVARVLKTDLRKIDSCARYGGEEFVILLPETDINGATSVGNRYLSEIREQDLSDICMKIKAITVSVGVVCLPNDDIKTTDVFLKCADDALYTAKKQGRNKMIIYHKN
jgi:diguanylate cyclase (GGDEF)-like protein